MKTIMETREALGITQKQMADYLGVSRQKYQRIEADPMNTTVNNAKKMCRVLGISMSEFFLLSAVNSN